ncbi:MAG: four helix bundle protein [Elusimicrobiota bacterium]|jgi:four helix bundle protein
MGGFHAFEDIQAWGRARELARQVYLVSNTDDFRRDYGLRDQIRRASVSVISNIAEGFERDGNTEFARFLTMAKGSSGEVRAQVYIALDQGYISQDQAQKLISLAQEVSRMIAGLIAYLRSHH